MAKLYIGLNHGETRKDIVTGNATTGKDLEVVLDDTKGLTKSEVDQKLEIIGEYLITHSNQFQ